MSETIEDVTDETFPGVVSSGTQPVLVDFWAPWCAPCRMVAPVLEALAQEYAGRLRIVKVNVDENPRTATSYRVSSIPTLILFKGGRPVENIIGAQPKGNIQSSIEKHLTT